MDTIRGIFLIHIKTLKSFSPPCPLYRRTPTEYNPRMTISTSSTGKISKGYAIAFASAAVLSTTAILIRFLTQNYPIPALTLAFWRNLFLTVVLVATLAIFRPGLLRIRRAEAGFLVLYGLELALFNWLFTLSVAQNGAAVSNVLVYCSTAFTALLGRWLLKERLSLAKLVAVAICLGGCVLVSNAVSLAVWQTNLLGIFTGILSGLGYAGYSLLGRSAARRGLNPWTTLVYVFGTAAAVQLLLNLIPGGLLPGMAEHPSQLLLPGGDWKEWGALFLLAVGPTLLGFGLYNTSLSYLESSVANLIVSLEPAITVVIAYFALGERFSWVQFVGGGMILGAVFIMRVTEGWSEARQQKKNRQGAESPAGG